MLDTKKKKAFQLNVSCSYITFSSNESAFYNLQFRSGFCHSEVLYNFTVTYIVFFSICEDFVSILHAVLHISREVIHLLYNDEKSFMITNRSDIYTCMKCSLSQIHRLFEYFVIYQFRSLMYRDDQQRYLVS
jgi:hypothetical protein